MGYRFSTLTWLLTDTLLQHLTLCILFIYICQLKRAVFTYTRYLISKCISQSDLFDIHLIKLSWKDMENGHKWVMENAHKKVMENTFNVLNAPYFSISLID